MLLEILQVADNFWWLPLVARVKLHYLSIRRDDGSNKRMNDLIGFRKVLQPEISRNLFHFIRAARSELPVAERLRAAFSCVTCAVLTQPRGRIVFRINADAQQLSLRVNGRVVFDCFNYFSEVVSHQRAIIGQRAARVDERQHQRAAFITAKPQALAVLIDKREIGHFFARLRPD